MAFTWTGITAGVTEIADAHQDEIRANIDVVLAALDTPAAPIAWAWDGALSGVGEDILGADVQELRDAADYLDDQNYCRAECTGNNSVDDISHNTGVLTGNNTSHLTGENITYLNADDGTWYSSHDVGYDGALNSSILGTQYGTRYGTQYAGNDAAYNIGYDSTLYSSYFATNDSGILS